MAASTKHLVLLVAVLLSLPATRAAAQAPGQRVRVVHRAADGRTAVLASGNLERRAGDTIVVRTTGPAVPELRTVVLSEGRSLETRVGRSRRTGRAMGIGALAGGAIFGVIGYATWQPCTETGFMACFMHPESRADQAVMTASIGALGGALIGLMTGAPADKWAPTGGVTLHASANRIGLGFSF